MIERSETARGTGWLHAAGALLIIGCGAVRLLGDPSFWLDEAYIAQNIQERQLAGLFAPLLHDQWFPRFYLAAIDALSQALGYSTLTLRLLPFVCFAAATALIMRLLHRLVGSSWRLSVLAVALVMPVDQWLLQAASLKQYTFDVLVALIPFLVAEEDYRRLLSGRPRWGITLLLALPLALSYSYPMPLVARLAAAWLHRGRHQGFRLPAAAWRRLLAAAALAVAAWLILWGADLRFNPRQVVDDFWASCVLRAQIGSPRAVAAVVGRLLFAWYRRTLPLLFTGVLAVALAAGVAATARRWWRRTAATNGAGSVALGSVLCVAGLLAASLLLGYPLCRGRLTLFVLVHLQILMIMGAATLDHMAAGRRATRVAMNAAVAIFALFALFALADLVRREAPENLRPLLSHLETGAALPLFVHDCTSSQWRTLPEAAAHAASILAGSPEENIAALEAVDGPAWLIWSHVLGPCGERLEGLRREARVWDVRHDQHGAALARVEYRRRP